MFRNTANNKNFYNQSNLLKINDQFFLDSKMALFPKFWGKNFFQKIGLSYNTTSFGLLASCQNSEKSNDPIPRKHPARQVVEEEDGQTLFHRILLAIAGGLTGTTTVD